ncbi:MAG: hypothetical protein ACRCWI_05720 [Brevinema sp.]
MSTLEEIKLIILQIVQETDVRKPDLFCSRELFLELLKRSDCQPHPLQKDTVVMLPNVYWTQNLSLSMPNIIAHTHRGVLILQYLELIANFIIKEHGSIIHVQNVVKDLINKRK